ncbi:hypothetical protein MASR2M17_13080 [Aminivibrio sp.]
MNNELMAFLLAGLLLFVPAAGAMAASPERVEKTDSEWKAILTTEQYEVTRKHGTERAFTGEYDDFYEKGKYACVGCGAILFTSEEKFKSGSGWPSFGISPRCPHRHDEGHLLGDDEDGGALLPVRRPPRPSL